MNLTKTIARNIADSHTQLYNKNKIYVTISHCVLLATKRQLEVIDLTDKVNIVDKKTRDILMELPNIPALALSIKYLTGLSNTYDVSAFNTWFKINNT